MDYRTYVGWVQHGRNVRAGEKANHYLIGPTGQSVAVFDEGQTDALDEPDFTGWAMVTAEQRRALSKRPPSKPKAKISEIPGGVAVWVGNQKTIIADLRKAGYVFNPRLYRWVGKGRTLNDVERALTARNIQVERV